MSTLQASLSDMATIQIDRSCVASFLFSLLGLMLSFILLMLNPDALVALGAY